MKLSSLSAIALAASLTSGAQGQPMQSSASMTQEELRDRVIELCQNPNFEKHLVNPKDTVCEFSTDGGKTWKEYIPNIPNGTTKIAGGGLAGLLLLLGTGAAIMRYRRKDEYTIAPNIGKKYVSPIKPKNNFSKVDDPEDVELGPVITRPNEQIQNNSGTELTIGDMTMAEKENYGDWDAVEEELARGNKQTNATFEAPIGNDPNEGLNKTQENSGTSPVVVASEISKLDPIDTSHNADNSYTDDKIKEKLQPIELSDEEKKDIEGSIVSITKLIKKNIDLGYGFDISDSDGSITLTAKHKGGKLYYLDNNGSVQETQYFNAENVAKFKVLGKGLYQIIHTNGKTQNILLVTLDS